MRKAFGRVIRALNQAPFPWKICYCSLNLKLLSGHFTGNSSSRLCEVLKKRIDKKTSTLLSHNVGLHNVPRPLALHSNIPTTLPPAYLSCEFAFYVRFQRVVRALSLIAYETRINVFRNS